MQVTKITSPEQLQSSPSERMTNEQLQNEYNYIRAEQITRKMLEKGLIYATICQQPERQGSEPLDILFNYIALDVQPEQEKVLTDIQILIRENL